MKSEEREPTSPRPEAVEPPPMPVRAWAVPLLRLDEAWARLEVKLATAVVVAEIVALVAWVVLKGLASEYQPAAGNASGLVVRVVLAAVILGTIAYASLRRWTRTSERVRVLVTSGVIVVAVIAARVFANAGATYFSNLLNWLQSSSTLTLIGGLSGVATRLTLWLALLGGAIATSQGKHINVDVVMRFLTPRLRVVVASLGWIAASIVCSAAVWGFIDDIAIGHFLAPADASPREKLAHLAHEARVDGFLVGRQLSLDARTLPHALVGQKYNEVLRAGDWNAWLRGGGWTKHFAESDVKALELPESDVAATRNPIISIPGSAENVPGLLVRDFDLVLPFGLFVLALRFLLRAVLAFAGLVRVDPDAAHGDEAIEEAQDSLHAHAQASAHDHASEERA